MNGITLQGQQPVSIAGHLLYDPLLDLRHPPLLPTEVNPDFRKDDRTSQGGRVLRGKYQHLRRQIKAPLEPRDSTIGPGGTGNALQAKSNITLDSFRAWGQRSHPNPTSSSSRYLPLSLILDALEDPPIRGYDNPDTTSASDQLISVSKPKRTLESIRSNEEDSPPPSLFLTKLKRLKSMQKRRKRTRRRRDGRT